MPGEAGGILLHGLCIMRGVGTISGKILSSPSPSRGSVLLWSYTSVSNLICTADLVPNSRRSMMNDEGQVVNDTAPKTTKGSVQYGINFRTNHASGPSTVDSAVGLLPFGGSLGYTTNRSILRPRALICESGFPFVRQLGFRGKEWGQDEIPPTESGCARPTPPPPDGNRQDDTMAGILAIYI